MRQGSNCRAIHVIEYFLFHTWLDTTDLKCSPREASDCPIFRFCHCGHVHVTAAGCINDIDDLWLPLSCDLTS